MRSTRIMVTIAFVIAVAALVFIQLGAGDSTASASSVDWKPFDTAVQLARSQGKRILVDVYTDWCTWCKKMEKEVYTDPAVAKAIQSHFIPVKLNAESSSLVTYDGRTLSEAQFARAMGVSGYPTTVFFESGGKPITVVSGFIPAGDFSTVLAFIGEGHYQSKSYDAFRAERQKTK